MFTKQTSSSHSFAALPQYHHFSSLALHKLQSIKKDNAVKVDFDLSFRGGHIIVEFSFFSLLFFWMYDMIAKLLQDNNKTLLIC